MAPTTSDTQQWYAKVQMGYFIFKIIVKTCTSINGAFYIWFVIIKILARHRSSIHIPVEDDANRKEQLHCIKNSRRITVPYHLLICQLDS